MTLLPGTYGVGVEGDFYEYWGGTYTKFSIPLGYPGARNLVVSADTVLNVPITTNTLTGRVVDAYGQGVPNVTASMIPLDWNPLEKPYWSSSTVSAADGSYKLLVLPGASRIQVTPPGGSHFSEVTIEVEITGDSVQDITLGEQLLLSGTLTFNGTPAAGWVVRAGELSGDNQGNSSTTDDNGNYQMVLYPGTYALGIEGTYVEQREGTSTTFSFPLGYPGLQNLVMSGDTRADIPVTTHTLTGSVMDIDGQGIPNVTVARGFFGPPYWGSSTVTAADGSYKLFVLPGTTSLQVTAPPAQYPPFTIQKITFTGDTTRDIVLSYDYTVLEDALASIPEGLNLQQDIFGIIDQNATNVYEVPITSSRDQMTLIPNWAGSELAVSVYRPDGSFYGTFQSTTPPIIVNIPDPEAGTWRCEVTAVDVPHDNYPIALVAAMPLPRFSDVVSGTWAYDFIMALRDSGITGGCADNPPRFCPDSPITRGQMAVFIETSLGNQPNTCTGRFLDVHTTNNFCGYIERLAADGISAGCSVDRFCPNEPVTRGQMAVFIEAALGKTPNTCAGRFTDVPIGHQFCGFVERLLEDGITGGCGENRYCPDSPVTRAEMAVFLVAAPDPLKP
jgi:hypothetical protein